MRECGGERPSITGRHHYWWYGRRSCGRPISAFARQYVADLEQAEAEAVATSSEGDEENAPDQETDPVDEEAPAGAGSSPENPAFEPTTFRARWLLTPASQGVLATVLCGLTLAWGALSEAWSETIVALPIVALLGAACSVDAVCHRLPNRILGPASLWPAQQPWLFSHSAWRWGHRSPMQRGRRSRLLCARRVRAP